MMNPLVPLFVLDLFLLAAQSPSQAAPWFDPSIGGWLGAAVGIFGGLYGTLLGVLGPRGAAKRFVYALHWTGVAGGAALLITGVIALLSGQPYAVWYVFGLVGAILAFVLLGLTPVMLARYREAEERRLEAEGFRRE